MSNVISDAVSTIGKLPIANARPDQIVESGDLVQLNGSGSSDPNGDTRTYQWTQTGGHSVTLQDPTCVNWFFTTHDIAVLEIIV